MLLDTKAIQSFAYITIIFRQKGNMAVCPLLLLFLLSKQLKKTTKYIKSVITYHCKM